MYVKLYVVIIYWVTFNDFFLKYVIFFCQPLSGEEHFSDGAEDDMHHNVEYDHEAFLGRDEERTFDQLSPEESKERLG